MIGELIEHEPIEPDHIRQQLPRIVEPLRTMTRMIDQMLIDAMSDTLDIQLRPIALDLATLARDVVESYRPMTQRKQQPIDLAAANPVPVIGDPDRLREALDNVISNAIKYSPVGGTRSIQVGSNGPMASIL